MPTSVKTGSQDLIVQPLKYGFGQGGGYATESHESTLPAQVDSKAQWAAQNGLFYDVEHGFGKSRISIKYNYSPAGGMGGVTTSSREALIEWEIIPLKTEVQILDARNPLTLKLINGQDGGTPAELQIIRKMYEQETVQDIYDENIGWQMPAGITSTPAMLLLKYLYDGQRTMHVNLPQLKNSFTVNSDYFNPVTFPSSPQLYSTPTLKTQFNFPVPNGSWGSGQTFNPLFGLPNSDTTLVIETLTPLGIQQTLGWGWLMDMPEASRIGRNKWKITYSWQYGLYGLDLYGGRL